MVDKSSLPEVCVPYDTKSQQSQLSYVMCNIKNVLFSFLNLNLAKLF